MCRRLLGRRIGDRRRRDSALDVYADSVVRRVRYCADNLDGAGSADDCANDLFLLQQYARDACDEPQRSELSCRYGTPHQTRCLPQESLHSLPERSLTLEQLPAETGISKSALGKYEADDFKDISPFSMVELAKFYGVSTDYLLGLTEQKNHPNTELDALHLGDDTIEVLRTGKFNHRLLSELICHKDFQRFMLDAEIYVDRIADMRLNDMNAVLEAVRQMALMKNGGNENDLHLRTLEVAQIREDEYFGNLIADDLKGILRDIRNEHRPGTMTADEATFVGDMQNQLQDAMNFDGSSEEKQARSFLATLGIDYDKLSKEQFVTLIEILKLSKHMKSPMSQRGKARPQIPHGKSKRKHK